MVLNDICEKCVCTCYTIHFQRHFENWASGNDNIDKIIQDSQLSTHKRFNLKALEWIPYNRFYDIKYIAKDRFCKVYRANWIDGNIENWDNENQIWIRRDQNMFVILKILNNAKTLKMKFVKFMNKVKFCYLIKFTFRFTLMKISCTLSRDNHNLCNLRSITYDLTLLNFFLLMYYIYSINFMG